MPAQAGRASTRPYGPCKVVILAGGYGTRLAEQTDEIPKPMVQIGSRPMLWHILKIYSHFGYNDFIIAAGYKAEAIKRFFLEYREHVPDLVIDFVQGTVERLNGNLEPWRVAIIDTGTTTQTGGRIKRLAALLGNETFMLTYGDGVADVDLRALHTFHRNHGRLATFTAVRKPSQFGVPSLDGDRVVRFSEKHEDETAWINGGFFVLEPRIMSYIEGDHTSFELDSLNRIASDDQLRAYRHQGFWHPMDTLRDVRTLNAMWAEARAPWHLWNS